MLWISLFCHLFLLSTKQVNSQGVGSVEAGRGFEGICRDGFRYQISRGCIDVNECIEQAPCKRRQQCRNLWGSYRCICPAGFDLNPATGYCVDKDECALGYCGNGQRCLNNIGSFTCFCSPGTTKIGKYCRDINECVQHPCHSNQYCINTRGSYMCKCRSGYHDAGDGTCADEDECRKNMCRGMGEVCQNTVGSYRCVCKDGFAKDQRTNGRYCIDVNECDLNQCPRYSECINTQGSYYCRCHRGFTKYHGMCIDNQECRLGEGSKCQWRCENVPGSFVCRCPSGYTQVDYACNDINECDSDGKKVCRGRGTCVNTHGSYKCIDSHRCPRGGLYRKLMSTDEFGYRQVTTNTCRKRRCRRFTRTPEALAKCRRLPLSISYHYVDITSGLAVPTDILRVNFRARRRSQRYHFSITQGDRNRFSLRQPSPNRPQAFLVLNGEVTGPAEFEVHVDMRTYNKRRQMRDSRMMTVMVMVSRYQF